MIPYLDLLVSQLADAPLTSKQQRIWQDLCSELLQTRMRVQELETRLKVLERQPDKDEENLHTMLTRPEFNREVARMLAFDERYGGTSSVLYFDIEDMEEIENKEGKELIKAIIRKISDALILNIRRSDIVGRLASEEFGILLPRCDNENAWKKGEQIADSIYESLSELGLTGAFPTVSYGAYTFRDKEDVATGLKQAATIACGAHKNQK